VPPLRARRDDILVLSEHFATRMCAELGRAVFPGFTDAALDVLHRHDWPGNVRELRNVVERSVYRAADNGRKLGTILLDPFTSPYAPAVPATAPATSTADKPAHATNGAAPAEPTPDMAKDVDFELLVRGYSERLLQSALQACRFNQAEAARRLGLTYYQFRHHLRTHGLLQEKRAGK
jgi:psp operon transcriptional activator